VFQKAQRVRRRFKVALSGVWKVGKTRAALSFPAPAVIDTHRGTDLYDGKYDFQVLHAATWKEIEAPLTWLRANAAAQKIQTLVIDDVSTIYDDLIAEVSAWRTNKSGSMAPLNQGDWGVIKRRWKAFLQMLLRLDLNVVLVTREKDEYEESTNAAGQDVRKKTGNYVMDVDRQTSYLFDFILHMYTEDNRKKGTSEHFVRVDGTRHNALPKYSVHNITGKRLYAELFEGIEGEVDKGEPAPQEEAPAETESAKAPEAVELATEPGAPDDLKPPTPEESLSQLNSFFGVGKIDPETPEATLEEIKVVMTKAGEMRWPDDKNKCRKQGCSANGHIHEWFTGKDGKSLIRAAWGVESSKELRKPQIETLHQLFGDVLAGRAFLARDRENTVYIANPGGVSEEEVKRKVLEYAK
jgi:hypothetical protein